MAVVESVQRVRAASVEELRKAGRLVVALNGHTVCLLAEGDAVHAVDNRCPHMGFPLHRGTVSDGILTCHWHHARFDLCTGGTFDQFADELRRFPVEVDGDDVYVDLTPRRDPVEHQRRRLRVGLERNISLVVAKAAIVLVEADPSGIDAFRAGLDFGVRRRGGGWFRGLTTLTCFMNLVPRLAGGGAGGGALPRAHRRRARLGRRGAALPARAAARRGRSRAAGALVPPLRRGARRRGRRARARLGGSRRRFAGAARGHALHGRDRPPLPRRRPHARLRQQGARGAGRRRLGARRGRACLAARPARLRGADGGVERLAQPGRPGRAARGCVRATASTGVRPRVEPWDGRAALVDVVLDGEAAEILEALLAALERARRRSSSPRP